jgi:hypothetical protein
MSTKLVSSTVDAMRRRRNFIKTSLLAAPAVVAASTMMPKSADATGITRYYFNVKDPHYNAVGNGAVDAGLSPKVVLAGSNLLT